MAETLAELRDRGVRLGIICDVGLTPSPVLRGWLDDHGVLELFDHWSFSDEVGWYKPAPQIFEHALAGLGGIAPGRAAHVGDLRRTDVGGAQAMGMMAVRYRGAYDDAGRPGRRRRPCPPRGRHRDRRPRRPARPARPRLTPAPGPMRPVRSREGRRVI